MRVLFVVLAVLMIVPDWSGASRLPLFRNPTPIVTATPVALYPDDPARRKIGPLTFLGGVSLRANDSNFGGVSALHVAGDRFTLLSDGGGVVRFRMGADWRPRDATAIDLPAGPGTGWTKMERDSESMVVRADGGILIGFERANAIWRYSPNLMRGEASVKPPLMSGWWGNSGAEAMAGLPDGGIVVFSEHHADWGKPGYSAVRFDSDPTLPDAAHYQFHYIADPGFSVTDAAALDDGRILVLLRHFDLRTRFIGRLQIVDSALIRPDAVVTGRTIASFERDVIHDNFEGLSVTREGDRTIVWIASDDNQLLLQRSLLLKFALDPAF